MVAGLAVGLARRAVLLPPLVADALAWLACFADVAPAPFLAGADDLDRPYRDRAVAACNCPSRVRICDRSPAARFIRARRLAARPPCCLPWPWPAPLDVVNWPVGAW